MTVAEMADRYMQDFGFMAINAVLEDAVDAVTEEGNCTFRLMELQLVQDELARRGLHSVTSEEEYAALCAVHGVPRFVIEDGGE